MMYLKMTKTMLETAANVLNPQINFEDYYVDDPDELSGYELEELEQWALDGAIHNFLRSFEALTPRWGTDEWCDLYWNALDYSRWSDATPEGLIQITFSWISHEKGIVRK